MIDNVLFLQLLWTFLTWGLLLLGTFFVGIGIYKVLKEGPENAGTALRANMGKMVVGVGCIILLLLLSVLDPVIRPRNVVENPAEPNRKFREQQVEQYVPEIKEPQRDPEVQLQEQREERDQTLEDIKRSFEELPDAP